MRNLVAALALGLLLCGCVSQAGTSAPGGDSASGSNGLTGITGIVYVDYCRTIYPDPNNDSNYSVKCTPLQAPDQGNVTITSKDNASFTLLTSTDSKGQYLVNVTPDNYSVHTVILQDGQSYDLYPQDAQVLPGKLVNLTYVYGLQANTTQVPG